MTDRPTDQVNYIMEPSLYRESVLIAVIQLQRYRHTYKQSES